MENKKELYINNISKQEIKLYEENRSVTTPLAPELLIAKCPLSCDNCKTIYSNKPTGIKIVCKCNCHNTLVTDTKKEM